MSGGLRATLVLIFTFGAGVVAGFFLEHHHRIAAPHAIRVTHEAEHEATMEELRELLQLTEGQMARIDAIMADRQQIVEQMWQQLRPEVQSAMRDVHSEVADVLTPEQRKLFHEWLLQRRSNAE